MSSPERDRNDSPPVGLRFPDSRDRSVLVDFKLSGSRNGAQCPVDKFSKNRKNEVVFNFGFSKNRDRASAAFFGSLRTAKID
jgi:hypothetical protein